MATDTKGRPGGGLDLGLLLIRLGIGVSMLLFHGWGKITGGPETWHRLGENMSLLRIRFAPVLWGFMGSLAESLGSVLLLLGLFFRPVAALLAFTMFVAVLRHLNLPDDAPNAGWKGASHALELLSVYVGLLLVGPGRYALSRPLSGLFRR